MPAADAEDDARLIASVATGDRSALRRLYERHSVKVYRFALRFVADGSAAEDVTNDVFIEALRSAHRFEARSQVSTWLLGIARFKALSVRRGKRAATDGDEALEGLEDDADDPETSALKRDKASALRRCIEKLSADHREVIDLTYFHEKSIAEIAQIVGIPENTVKTRMFHARRKLSEMMAAAGIDRGWP